LYNTRKRSVGDQERDNVSQSPKTLKQRQRYLHVLSVLTRTGTKYRRLDETVAWTMFNFYIDHVPSKAVPLARCHYQSAVILFEVMSSFFTAIARLFACKVLSIMSTGLLT